MSKKKCRLGGGKVKFATHEAALTRAGEILVSLKDKPDCPPSLSAYRCPHGDHYHLTSAAPLPIPASKRQTRVCEVCRTPFFLPKKKSLQNETTCSPRCAQKLPAKDLTAENAENAKL